MTEINKTPHSTDWFGFWNTFFSRADLGSNLRPPEYDVKKVFDHLDKYMHFKFGESVLDAGCGTGFMVALLSRRVSMTYGIDYSTTAIEVASSYLRSCGGVVVRQQDIRKIDYQDGVFSKVICGGVFQYLGSLKEAKTALSELYRLCSKGGLIMIYDVPDARKIESSDGINTYYPEELLEEYNYKIIESIYEPDRRFDALITKNEG